MRPRSKTELRRSRRPKADAQPSSAAPSAAIGVNEEAVLFGEGILNKADDSEKRRQEQIEQIWL